VNVGRSARRTVIATFGPMVAETACERQLATVWQLSVCNLAGK